MVSVTQMMPCIPCRYWPVTTVCSLLADTLEDLHSFARFVGLNPKLFEDGICPRYNLTIQMRAEALAAGAVPINQEQYDARVSAVFDELISRSTGGV